MSLHRWLRYLAPEPVQLSVGERVRTAIAAFLGMLVVTAVSARFMDHSALPLVAASMGASAVLVFALPSSPLAQPWPLVGSHLISAAIGVACDIWIPDRVLAAALAVSLAILAMHFTHTLHPPGGAAALLPVVVGGPARDAGWHFILFPIGVNVLVILVMALLVNNVILRRRYPARPYETEDEVHHHADPKSLDRVGITHDDLHHALAEMDVFVDISEEDLTRIYRSAGMHAYRRRMGEITCAEIMSQDMVTVTPDTELEEAWALLRKHRIRLLPVVDAERRVVGVVSLVDVLKRIDLRTYYSLEEKVIRFVRRTLGIASRRPTLVREVMSPQVVTVDASKHIAEIVPLLSDDGMHHLPVVDSERRLLGIVTQSDLIAGLYAGAIQPIME